MRLQPARIRYGDPAGLFAYPTSPYSALQERKTMTSDTVREPTRIVTAHRQREGAGFIVRRPFPAQGLDVADPFLLLDEMGPVEYGPGEAVGAPDHPHRGFETITYMLEGEFEHEDSAGHRGVLRPGDVQWMTAGAGIVHSEMPSHEIREKGARVRVRGRGAGRRRKQGDSRRPACAFRSGRRGALSRRRRRGPAAASRRRSDRRARRPLRSVRDEHAGGDRAGRARLPERPHGRDHAHSRSALTLAEVGTPRSRDGGTMFDLRGSRREF